MKHIMPHDGLVNRNPPWTYAAVQAGSPIGDALGRLGLPAREFPRGAHLFRTGDNPKSVYLVQSGSLKLYVLSSNGSEQIIGFRFAGDILGMEALEAPGYGCSALVLEAARIQVVPHDLLEEIWSNDPALQRELLGHIGRRVAELEEHALMLGGMDAAERLAVFLTRLSARLHGEDAAQREICLSMSRYDIGSYLGIALETVSRLLGQFENKGLIRVERRRVRIVDRDRLCALAGLMEPPTARGLPVRIQAVHGHA